MQANAVSLKDSIPTSHRSASTQISGYAAAADLATRIKGEHIERNALPTPSLQHYRTTVIRSFDDDVRPYTPSRDMAEACQLALQRTTIANLQTEKRALEQENKALRRGLTLLQARIDQLYYEKNQMHARGL